MLQGCRGEAGTPVWESAGYRVYLVGLGGEQSSLLGTAGPPGPREWAPREQTIPCLLGYGLRETLSSPAPPYSSEA